MQESPKIPSLGSLSTKPDEYTQKAVNDFTGPRAENRVLHISLPFIKYGTNCKVHAAALILSIIIFITIVLVAFSGVFVENTVWLGRVFDWLCGSFLLTLGVLFGSKISSGASSLDAD